MKKKQKHTTLKSKKTNLQKHNLELQQQEIEQRREAAIEQKNLEYLEHIIKNPQDLFYTLCANPDVHYMPMFVPLAAKYNLLDKLLTSEVLTIPMIVNSFDLNDLCCIINYVCDSSNPKALLGNLFEIEGFKLKLAEYANDEQIIKRLSYAIEYPEVASAVLNLQNININLLTSAFAVLVKNQGIDSNVFDYFDFANLQHKEAFESMIFGSDISKKLKSWLLNKALEKGYDFSYIDAPKIEYRNADISPSIEKVINNIHTKFEHQGQLIENIVTRLQKFLGQNKLITEIIEYGLGKHQIYIGTNDIPGVGIDTAGVTSRNDYFITIKRADELASSNDADLPFCVMMHEATHAACGEFFDNSFKPYSKIINGKKEKEFAKHIDRLVANKAIIDTYKLTNWSEGRSHDDEIYVKEFIANFIQSYCFSSLTMPKIQSFQGYVKNVLLPILQNHQTNPIDQITCKSLLQFAGYLDDSNGFLKNAHHNMSLINELNESAAIFFSSDNSDANVDYIGDSGIDY